MTLQLQHRVCWKLELFSSIDGLRTSRFGSFVVVAATSAWLELFRRRRFRIECPPEKFASWFFSLVYSKKSPVFSLKAAACRLPNCVFTVRILFFLFSLQWFRWGECFFECFFNGWRSNLITVFCWKVDEAFIPWRPEETTRFGNPPLRLERPRRTRRIFAYCNFFPFSHGATSQNDAYFHIRTVSCIE